MTPRMVRCTRGQHIYTDNSPTLDICNNIFNASDGLRARRPDCDGPLALSGERLTGLTQAMRVLRERTAPAAGKWAEGIREPGQRLAPNDQRQRLVMRSRGG